MIGAIRSEIDAGSSLGLMLRESLSTAEKSALEYARDEDVKKIEQKFIKYKFGIRYFPSENKKSVKINGETKIVQIDEVYGSEND